MATQSSTLSTVLLVFLLVSPFSSSSASSSPSSHRELLAIQRTNTSKHQNQIPRCCETRARSQCSLNPKCRWCRSQVLDDTCFSKAEAWRLPHQVFICDS